MATAQTQRATVVVNAESPDAVRAEAAEVLRGTRRDEVDEARFDWLYRANPDGEAAVWVARAAETGEIAGFTAALPRRMLVDGRERIGWNCADFSMEPRYRTLGPAVKLRRAARDGVDAGRVEFLYAHPNERMTVIHQRVGHRPVGRMLRYARPLRTAEHWRKRLGSRWAGRAAAGLVDPLLRLAGRELRHRPACRVRPVEESRFDERFDRLFEDQAPRTGIIGVRDARYLNWRYADNPLYRTEALVAERDGRLQGYLLFVEKDGMLSIKDVFPPQDRPAVRDLVAAAVREGFRRALTSISITALQGHPLLPVFAQFGFRQRPDGSQMFAYAPAGSPLAEKVDDAGRWVLTVGDRDV